MRKDKIYHIIAGLIIALVSGIISPILGLILGCLAGICKEVYDKKSYGLFDIYDMLATFAGSAVGYIIIKLL